MKDPIEEFGFRLSLGVQEVDTYLTKEEIAEVERLAILFKARRDEHLRIRKLGLEWLKGTPTNAPLFDTDHPMRIEFGWFLRSKGLDWFDVEQEMERREENRNENVEV